MCQDLETKADIKMAIREHTACELKTKSPWTIYKPKHCPWNLGYSKWKEIKVK